MDISEIELEFLKDIWADTSRREIAKRAIAIALSRAAKYTLLGDVMEQSLTACSCLRSRSRGTRTRI
jgi:hypothetical protein